MEFFLLRPSINEKEIGRFPQCEKSISAGNLDNLNPNGWIGNNISLPIPILHENAKFTSYLNIVVANPTRFLVVDSELLAIINEMYSSKFERWKIGVQHKNTLNEDYSLLHFLSSESEYVDYELSEFYIGRMDNWRFRGSELHIRDREDYVLTENSLLSIDQRIVPQRIVLNFKKATQHIARLDNIPTGKGYYFSEQLVSKINEAGLTGMLFKDIESAGKGKLVTLSD